MSKLVLFSLLGVAILVVVPILASWYVRGWVAKYDSPPYSFDHIPDQTGKFVVVTGGNTGIGKVTVRELARKGAQVVLASRGMDRGEAAKNDICSAIAPLPCNVEVMQLDLASLASVESFASKISRVDTLILNAGIMACPYKETADGIEMQFGTNHLGHFYLVDQLMPMLEASNARVVTVSSSAHEHSYSEGIRFNQLTNNHNYDLAAAYGQSKLANILFSNELSHRAKASGSGITANSLHPGFIVTDLMRHIQAQVQDFGDLAALLWGLGEQWIFSAAMNADDGALTQLYVATAPELANVSGKYFQPIAKEGTPIALSSDRALQKRLWEESERLVQRYRAHKTQQLQQQE